ncbi:2-phospho-L-lactate guanylyltransferase [Methanococcus voltae]|jgi:2-phospho-L-lactate guanylyltransferase|uniref:2-phospho-L-lactate guanylyltransferase n=2 Tax=Methanococcus voltae TaxID=2188 RepID=A0A8J7RJ03_METVO|nr:CofC family guanylyltransferase [Methanococcus voltae]MBP2201776.1 2-phospho-L-lactate guanylyltransferase [Methanococcus voltae]MCS3922600.1 2-phospho-L-lactate guanylyltransferase [Methanococcus voltae PS]
MIAAIIPVSPLSSVKTRLKEFLTPKERIELIKTMIMDTYEKVSPICDTCYIISKDNELLNEFSEYGIVPIKEPHEINNLNDAIDYAINYVKEDSVLIAPADIPLIKNEDLKSILYNFTNNANNNSNNTNDRNTTYNVNSITNINNSNNANNNSKANNGSILLCPSRGGGTNLLLMSPKTCISPKFEGFSYVKHLEEAISRDVDISIVPSFYMSIDVNTVEDLGEIFIHGKNTLTYNYLKKIGIIVDSKHSSAGRFDVKRLTHSLSENTEIITLDSKVRKTAKN